MHDGLLLSCLSEKCLLYVASLRYQGVAAFHYMYMCVCIPLHVLLKYGMHGLYVMWCFVNRIRLMVW